MLNKNQLEKAAAYMKNESRINPKVTVTEIIETALAYREILENRMWHKRSSDGEYFCIECGINKNNGHMYGCKLKELLKE